MIIQVIYMRFGLVLILFRFFWFFYLQFLRFLFIQRLYLSVTFEVLKQISLHPSDVSQCVVFQDTSGCTESYVSFTLSFHRKSGVVFTENGFRAKWFEIKIPLQRISILSRKQSRSGIYQNSQVFASLLPSSLCIPYYFAQSFYKSGLLLL